jgi:hypothetical protein
MAHEEEENVSMELAGGHLVPVDSEPAGACASLADAPLGLAAQPLQSALVLSDVWLELLVAAPVVVLQTTVQEKGSLHRIGEHQP